MTEARKWKKTHLFRKTDEKRVLTEKERNKSW